VISLITTIRVIVSSVQRTSLCDYNTSCFPQTFDSTFALCYNLFALLLLELVGPRSPPLKSLCPTSIFNLAQIPLPPHPAARIWVVSCLCLSRGGLLCIYGGLFLSKMHERGVVLLSLDIARIGLADIL